ncbi:hypothetical protein NIES4071_106050 (plasmid) [Calothrix sp. NIES-4071]|nr:hypothetical protein NIES4071_106050 [Calothrix sp. NIES-4071]BAZ65023.1 hypothetical protein NIES4105_107560 [Calothrix sp. NIES-4105]
MTVVGGKQTVIPGVVGGLLDGLSLFGDNENESLVNITVPTLGQFLPRN